MPPENRIHIGELSPGDVALLKDVAEAAAEKAVNKCLIAMGLDPNDPIKAQEDFSIMRYVGEKIRDPEFKEDLAWLRRSRTLSQGIFGKAFMTAVGLACVGALNALWQGLMSIVRHPPGP